MFMYDWFRRFGAERLTLRADAPKCLDGSSIRSADSAARGSKGSPQNGNRRLRRVQLYLSIQGPEDCGDPTKSAIEFTCRA